MREYKFSSMLLTCDDVVLVLVFGVGVGVGVGVGMKHEDVCIMKTRPTTSRYFKL